jgi:hypothetical protein
MKFTKEQIELVNKKREKLIQQLDTAEGMNNIIKLRARAEALTLLIEIHNFQVDIEKKAKALKKAESEELPEI